MHTAVLIIPRTGTFAAQKASGRVFGGKNTESIDDSAENGREAFQQGMNGKQEGTHTIYKEHKNRSCSRAGSVAPPQRLQGGK